ncbi:MAG: 5'-methylthioadenosine/adenosylhomocysteine nucleosidase [Hydrogeniiclostridium sp.]
MIGIIGAMAVEVEGLIAAMENKSPETVSRMTFWRGTLAGVECVVAQCGAGKVNSAVCAQTMILRYGASPIINTGVAGGVGSRAVRIGDLVVAEGVTQHDYDTTPIDGDKGRDLPILGRSVLETDARVSGLLADCAREVYDGNVHRGLIATGDQFIGGKERLHAIAERTGAIACEMEGGSIGQACALADVPFAVLRAISDNADDNAVDDFPKFAKESAEKSVALLLEALPRL